MYESVMNSVNTYLGVCRGHLLVQILMAVDSQLQLLHGRGQSSFTARLHPTLHSGEKLPNHSRNKERKKEETNAMPIHLSLKLSTDSG